MLTKECQLEVRLVVLELLKTSHFFLHCCVQGQLLSTPLGQHGQELDALKKTQVKTRRRIY